MNSRKMKRKNLRKKIRMSKKKDFQNERVWIEEKKQKERKNTLSS
jgi:hypothetical protein